MKIEFTNNTVELFAKALFHYVPDILNYIDEIADPRRNRTYSMRYLIISEMLMFLSSGGSQRFTETAFDENYLQNIASIIKEEVLEKVPDAEIYTDVFSKIKCEDIEKLQYKINYRMLRNKTYENSKILGKYNILLDGTRFQKAYTSVSTEWLHEEINDNIVYYVAMLEAKLAANLMAVPLCSEMIRNEDGKEKQDCEINAAKRLIVKIKETYPRLPIRIVADSLYPSESLIKLSEANNIEYLFVLKDKRIPSILTEFVNLVGLEKDNLKFEEYEDKAVLTLWVNDIDYCGSKVNVVRQITHNKSTKEVTRWMWITSRKITKSNVEKIVTCGKMRDYIENQGFREQKITSGIDLEHVYSKNIEAIKVIYTIIQTVHLMLQILEHSDICEDFSKKYGSVKVFAKKFYAHLTERIIDMVKILELKIQIRYPDMTIII
ncbi:MAG: hypothetical protein RSB87_07245 [Clostridia bacterium]